MGPQLEHKKAPANYFAKYRNSGDKCIETNRGKFFRKPPWKAEDLDEDRGCEAVDIKNMTGDNIDNIDLDLD